MDKLIRGTAKDGEIRFFAAVTTNLVQKASQIHDCYPVTAAALGRMLTGASMMGAMLKNHQDLLTVQINGGGAAGTIIATANSRGIVKGYVSNPHVDRPLNKDGKLDVGGAVGKDGRLVVIKDMGLKEPYIGQVPITSGEIAEDITYYFAASEQIPSAVSLGVLVGDGSSIISAGGFIIQMMPGANDFTRDIIGYRLDEIPPVTQVIKDTGGIDAVLYELFDGMNHQVHIETEPDFICECSRDRVEKVLLSMGEAELRNMADEEETTEINCHFCNKKYVFTRNDIYNLIKGSIV